MAVRTPPVHDGFAASFAAISLNVSVPKLASKQKQADEEAKVADTVNDECFFAGVGGGGLLKPETDEQIGSETNALPADKEQQGVSGEYENRHEEHEQVHVREESPVALVLVHVADGVDVDQETNAGDDQKHDQRKLIEHKTEIDVQSARGNPLPVGFDMRQDIRLK